MSGKEFMFALWRFKRLDFKPGELSLLYQGISTKFMDPNNLVDRIK